MKKLKFFPLVGILASNGSKKDSFRGDASLFKAIQKQLMSKGGLSFVFTTDHIQKDCIIGFIFSEQQQKWGRTTFPFPSIIYNKISSRSEEKSTAFQTIQQLYLDENKPFFNSGFFNKWECYKALAQEKELQLHLPKTWLHSRSNNILDLLETHAIYAKPTIGHKGKGIYKLVKEENTFYILSKDKCQTYNEEQFLLKIDTILTESYILQQEIKTDTVEDCKYDLRIHCLYHKDSYYITGIGVRKAAKNSIITHVPNGGEIIPFSKVANKCSIHDLNHLAHTVGTCLSKQIGFVGEFSMDVGITPNGTPYIFEVNSKPMLFDEIDIQHNRITRLVDLFFELTNKNH
ncbi:YheC/YheD family protein [Metabacillus litoralis]|uniref:YheC/YheD family endospore coat-associated protein n=1 Tax=Metabacillus litoralis TaxID=152268 RepID=UPI001CFE29D8|nr:YheC/YheD family protein [Metabacillus litoralis]